MSAPAARLRDLLERSRPVVAPGAFNALFARAVEAAGFDALYLSGAGVSNALLGRPDVGLTTLTEMAETARHVCDAVSLPVFADADTGYGGPHNIARTVAEYERAGVAAIQIEDQADPKLCGHFAGKRLVSAEEMLDRIAAARDARRDPDTLIVARTDAAGVEGLDEAIARARRYGEAGADALFVEAPRTDEELARVGAELAGWPLVANMVEFGRTPLLPADRLHELGFALVIFPGSLTRALTRRAFEVLGELRRTGTTAGVLDEMATFDEVNELLGLPEMRAWEERTIGDSHTERA